MPEPRFEDSSRPEIKPFVDQNIDGELVDARKEFEELEGDLDSLMKFIRNKKFFDQGLFEYSRNAVGRSLYEGDPEDEKLADELSDKLRQIDELIREVYSAVKERLGR